MQCSRTRTSDFQGQKYARVKWFSKQGVTWLRIKRKRNAEKESCFPFPLKCINPLCLLPSPFHLDCRKIENPPFPLNIASSATGRGKKKKSCSSCLKPLVPFFLLRNIFRARSSQEIRHSIFSYVAPINCTIYVRDVLSERILIREGQYRISSPL